MTFEELEFAISQYLDGTLPAAQVAELEARLAVDAAARALLDEYRRLDSALKLSGVPALQWDRLAEHLSNAVAADAEQVEFAAIDYVDGAMPVADAVAFASRAAEEPGVEKLVASHQKLRGALKALPKPKVHWNRLAEYLYDHAAGVDRTIKLDAFRWMRLAGGLAVAACVMIVTALGVRQHLNDGHSPNPHAVAQSRMEIQIDGGDEAAPRKELAVADISIGGSDNPDAAEGIVVAGSPHSLVAVSTPVAQDVPMPY